MHSVWTICSPLYPIRPIWSRWFGVHGTETHTGASRQHEDRHLQIPSTDLLRKIQAVTFIRRPGAKNPPPPLQTKGQVCGRADILTSPSNSLTLQRQRLCLVTCSNSDGGSAAPCEPVLPEAAVGEAVSPTRLNAVAVTTHAETSAQII